MARSKIMGVNNFEEIASAMRKSRINLYGQGGIDNARTAVALMAESFYLALQWLHFSSIFQKKVLSKILNSTLFFFVKL